MIAIRATWLKSKVINAKKLKDIPFEAIFSSDYIRAKETAEILKAERNIIVLTKEMIRERQDLSGRPSLLTS